MNEQEFFKLVYEQYKREMDQADTLYQRVGVLLTALPLLGAIIYGLGRTDLITRIFTRVDIFIYYIAISTSVILLVMSIYFLIRCICPRKYPVLASMKEWHTWRNNLRKHFGAEKESTPTEDKISKKMLRDIISLTADAEEKCSEINEIRRKQFNWSIRAASFSAVGIMIQAIFRLLLNLQGI